ncbi:hypothetical protein CJ030_MR3G019186 [Morella rubra]|uniref:Uncharacterized protein n=1 Tax=Morella rubra TaxID=262757 RepID=A0A6A1W497_9ROSI|nr:hypothetical protein CJ030_MR3G019186 [Morella rubra]
MENHLRRDSDREEKRILLLHQRVFLFYQDFISSVFTVTSGIVRMFDVEPTEILRVVMDDPDLTKVKKAVATPSQEIQEEEAEEEEAEENDPKEVEPATEDRAADEIPILASPHTPHTSTVGRSAPSISHATRLALLEASISDLKE